MLASFLSGSTIRHILGTYGYGAVFGLIGIESLGIPAPGETTLIVAALYAGATHHMSIWLVIAAGIGGAVVGDNIGYSLGYWGGFRLLRRYGPRLHFGERRLKLARYLFLRHGGKVVFFGRFVAVLRAYAAFLAGTTRMPWRRFLVFNAGGGVVWVLVYAFAFYYLGSAITQLQTPIDIGIGAAGAVVVVAFVLYVHRHEQRLADEAERRLPDDVEDAFVAGEEEHALVGNAPRPR
jgi:membrane protein DedA with SNARE-associated domain